MLTRSRFSRVFAPASLVRTFQPPATLGLRASHRSYSSRSGTSSQIFLGSGLLAVGGVVALSLAVPVHSDEARATSAKRRIIPAAEVLNHVSRDSVWVVVEGNVWDVTEFLDAHPAGAEVILEHAGKDITALFNSIHPPHTLTHTLPPEARIGRLDPATPIEAAFGDENEAEYERARAKLPPVSAVINLEHFERLAKQLFGEDGKPWGFFSSYADDGASFAANRASWSFLRFLPRVLVPVSVVDASTRFLSQPSSLPIYISPTGLARIGHPGGEFNLLRGAARAGIPFCVSSGSSASLEDLYEERDRFVEGGGERARVWFQLYVRSDRTETEKRIRAAVEGGAEAICFTVDAPTIGNRESDKGVHAKPVDGSKPKDKLVRLFDADLKWDDIRWIRSLASGVPLLIKGIGSAADARLAYEHGADGVILSNHGGRQLDFAPPPVATLLHIREQYPEVANDPKFEIYVDGGVRRGTDVLKALCLGARGVGLGRTFLYAHSTYGEEGVVRACTIMREEIETGMRLLGARTVEELKPEMIEVLDGLLGKQAK